MKTFLSIFLFALLLNSNSLAQGDNPEFPKILLIGEDQIINCTLDPVRIGIELDPWISGVDYQWSNGVHDSTQFVKPSETETYSITITHPDLGIELTREIEVRVENDPVFADDKTIVIDKKTCPGSETTLSIEPHGGYEPYTYAWDFKSTEADPTINPTEDVQHTVTITDFCGSETTAKVVIHFEEHDPILTGEPQVVAFNCIGKQIELNPDLSQVSGGVGYGYKFSSNNWESSNKAIEVEAEDGRKLTFSVTDACGLQFEVTEITLKHKPLELLTAEPLSACFGDTVEIVKNNDEFYFWDGEKMHANYTHQALKDATFQLSYIDACGEEQKTPKTLSLVEATSNFNFELVHFEREVSFYAAEQPQGSSFKWYHDGELFSTERNPEIEFLESDINEVTLEVESPEGCMSETSREIILQDGVSSTNAFSPNGDGINDYFSIDIKDELKSFHIQIFDRWGQLAYESNDQYFKWDGQKFPENQAITNFAYVLKAETIAGRSIEKRGTITTIYAK
ncbi:MAG: gliding motility-associated C-terminal domain-containing protein [Salibacteraceae bacterium]